VHTTFYVLFFTSDPSGLSRLAIIECSNFIVSVALRVDKAAYVVIANNFIY
jgi:hypothetical protein